MGRLKRLARVGILTCFVACLVSVFALRADAAKIEFMVKDITEPNLSVTVDDGKLYTKKLEPSIGYKLPTTLLITVTDGNLLPTSAYSYSPETGILTIQADSVYGTLTVLGAAGELKPVETPTVSGKFVVYETLSAVVNPSGATVTYQWYRDKTAISGATSPTYTLTIDDIGKEINVQITGVGDYGGQKISTTNTLIAKKTTVNPAQSDVTVTHVTQNGGTNGAIASNSKHALQYYDTVATMWKDFPVRNKSAGEYQIRFKETTDTQPSESTVVRIFEPCASPVITDVTVKNIDTAGAATGKLSPNTNKLMEYYNGSAWVSLPVSGLKAGKYQVRFAATTDYLASEPTNFFVMEPTSLVITPADVKVTHVTVKGEATGALRAVSASAATMEALVDGVWKTIPQTALKAGTYQVRYAETETTFPSGACNVTVKEPADAPTGIKVTDVTTHGGNNGVISNLKTTWQVSYDNVAWNDCTQASLTGLSAGNYYFRTKESATHLASAVVKLTVKQPEPTPAAAIDFVNGTLKKLVANAEYIIGDVTCKASKDGTISILENNFAGKTISIIQKGNGTTTNNSAAQKLTVPARPASPAAPVIVSKTDTTVTITVKSGLEYSIDGSSWTTPSGDSYVFTKLKANTDYTVYARVKAVEGKSFSSVNAGTAVTTKKSSAMAVAPKKATAKEITDTTITIEVVSGQEYRIGETWVKPETSTYTWSGLKEKTNYQIETRTAETADTMYSAVTYTAVTTYTKLTIPVHSVDYWKKAIVGLPQGSYSINGGSPVTVGSDGLLDIEDYFGRSVILRRLGSVATKTVDSDPVTVNVSSPVVAPTAADFDFSTVHSTLTGFEISSATPNLEFQVLDKDGFPISDWKSPTDGKVIFAGLTHSTPYLIQVCFKVTETAPKSNAYISGLIYTRFYEGTPTATADTVAVKLAGLTANAAYLINGASYTADAEGTIPVQDAWIGTNISIVKCGNGKDTADSLPQRLLLPARISNVIDVTVHPVTYRDGDNGALSRVDSTMEFSDDGGASWKAITESTITGLSVREYLIRYRGVANEKFPSEAQTVTVTLDEEIAAYKEKVIAQLEQAYEDMVASRRYNEAQLGQIRAILDDGIQNIRQAFTKNEEVDNARNTVLANMAQVPCNNTPTADGKLVGTDITADTSLQYPENSDEIWGNVSNFEGLDAELLFVIKKLGYTDTETLRAQIAEAIAQKTIASADGSLTDEELQNALTNAELKLGLDITLNRGGAPTDMFKGVYTVTVLLPSEMQGLNGLNVISVDAAGNLAYHTAEIVGNYLSFDTDHFSVYGIIGADTLAIAKAETLQKINDLSNAVPQKKYSKDRWNDLVSAFATAIGKVNNALTEQEVNDAWLELVNTVEQMPTKKALGWLWILIFVLIILIAFVVACYLVWHVRYFDGDEQIQKDFHFWHSKVALLSCDKDGYVLEGWYHDPELTDRAENGFPMPWHGVKLYAKWNQIEILPTLEEEPAVEPEAPETVIEATEEAIDEPIVVEETVDASAEEVPDETNDSADNSVALLAEAPQTAVEEPVEEEPEELEKSDPAEATPDEVIEVVEDATPEEISDEIVEASDEELPEEADMPEEETVEDERPAVIVVGDPIEDETEETAVREEDDGYRQTESYRAWLEFGEGESNAEVNEIEQLENGDEVQLFVNEKTGEKYHIRFNLSFRAKMTSLSDEAKGFYRELKDEFLTYKGVKTRINWKAEGVRKGRETIARFAVRDSTLCVFLALDPDAYTDSKYVFESVKDIKAYEAVPMLIRVKSDLSCRKVKELISDIMQPREVKRLDAAPETDYSYLDEDSSTEARLRAGQLRIWAEGPDDQVCANRAAAATLHYLISPETTAEEAEQLISDEMLDALMPSSQGILIVPDEVGEVSIEQLCKKFYVGDTVDIESMKEKGLLSPDTAYVKIVSEGDMTKKLTVSAHMFERTAAKMILLTGGDVNIITE